MAPAFEFLAYSAAKAALNHLMLSLAHYFAKQIRVNSLVIGTVLTPGYADVGLDESILHALAHPNNLTGRVRNPAGRRERVPVAGVPGRQLGQRPDHPGRRRRRADEDPAGEVTPVP